jgi:hypothetical protein
MRNPENPRQTTYNFDLLAPVVAILYLGLHRKGSDFGTGQDFRLAEIISNLPREPVKIVKFDGDCSRILNLRDGNRIPTLGQLPAFQLSPDSAFPMIALSCALPRDNRDITVPTGIPSAAPISRYEKLLT